MRALGGLLVFYGGMAAILILPIFIAPLIVGRPKPNVIRPFGFGYCSVLSLLSALVFGTLGLLGHVWQRGWGQIIPWALLVSGFAVPGIGCLIWGLKRKLILSEMGITVHSVFRPVRKFAWKDIHRVEYRRWGESITLVVGKGADCRFSVYYTNIGYLLKAAEDRGIPLFGFPKAKN